MYKMYKITYKTYKAVNPLSELQTDVWEESVLGVFFSLPVCRLSLWMGITWALCLMSWATWCSSAVSGSPSTHFLTSPPCWRGSALWTGCSWPGTESKPWSSAACWGWVMSRTSTCGEPRAHRGALFMAWWTSIHLCCHWFGLVTKVPVWNMVPVPAENQENCTVSCGRS